MTKKKKKKSWKDRDYKVLERALQTKKRRKTFIEMFFWYMLSKEERIENIISRKKHFKKLKQK